MKLGFIGLGRMGKAMVLHLLEEGVDVVAFNRSKEKTKELVISHQSLVIGKKNNDQRPKTKDKELGHLYPAYSIEELIRYLESPRLIWLMVPSGGPVDEMIKKLIAAGITKDDIVIDGGNSFYKDSIRRYHYLLDKEVNFLDVGTSGGLEGARNGACLMVGGDKTVYNRVRPYFEAMGQVGGVGYFGPSGAGHFVKMIHNAIEYGMMGAIAEGFNLVRSKQFAVGSNSEFKIDLAKLAKVWANGSIISGLLMNMAAQAFDKDPELNAISGEVPKGETEAEMEWLASTGISHPVIAQARIERVQTRSKPSFIGKVIAALRNEFGGHEVKKSV